MKNTAWIRSLSLMGLLAMPAIAEETTLPIAPVVVQKTSGFYGNPNTIQNNMPTNEVSGREMKANDATNQANSGQGAAIGAGIALTGAAAAAFAALNIPLGVTLMTMAGLEFAQAGADSGVAGANNAQENMLRANAGQTSNQSSYDPNEVANQIGNAPGVLNALNGLGIDPQEFISGLANGQYSSPEEVISAIGQEGNFTTEQVAAMGDFSQVDMSAITGEEGNAAASVLGFDDGSNGVASSSARGMAGGANGDVMGGVGAGGASAGGASAHGGKADRSLASIGDAESAGGFNISGLSGAAAKAGAAGGFAGSFAGMDRVQLKQLGILKPHGKRTIFQIANRNYRSFQAWRKSKAAIAKTQKAVPGTRAAKISLAN